MEAIFFAKPTFVGSDKTDVLADAEVYFGNESVFSGMKLTGIQVRRSKKPERDGSALYITFPAKAAGLGSERRYFDFLRSIQPMTTSEGRNAVRRIRIWIESEYRSWEKSQLGDGTRKETK